MADDHDDADSPRKIPELSVPQLEECLWVAAQDGHMTSVVKFLEERSQHPKLKQILNCENEEYEQEGGSILLHCVRRGRDKGKTSKTDYPGVIARLVQAGADLDQKDKYRRTPLNWCVRMKYINYVKHLLKLGARADVADQDDLNPFNTAIVLGHKDILNAFIDHNPENVNLRDNKGVPPLVIAVKHAQTEICRLLLEHGADVNAAEDKTKRTAIYHAIRNKYMDIYDMLLKHNPTLDTVDTEGHSLVYLCCAHTDVRYFQKLVAHCPTFSTSIMDQQAEDNKTAVIVACQNGNAEQLKHVLEQGASVSIKDVNQKTCLHHCTDNLETQCAEMVLDKDSSILDLKDDQGYTPLALAVLAGNTNLIKLLLDKGADINTTDDEGHKLAHWASVCGHLKVMDMLIQQKADFSSHDNHHAYPVHYAAQMNGMAGGRTDAKLAEKVLRKVIEYKVKLDVVDDSGRQPLLWAACSGNALSCKLLLTAGADINSRDKDDLTALHCAASRGHQECIEVLLKKGADPNLMDKNKCTPLFYAITLGNKECTRLLINAKADVNHVDDRGRNPSHCAAIKGCLDTVKLLEKEKAEFWNQNNKGDFPIHEAAQKGHIDVVKYLIRVKNDRSAVNITNKVGKTLLHIAAATNNLPLCKLLINHDCDKNATMKHSEKEFTAYDLAVIKNYKETADYLKSKGAVSNSDLANTDKKEGKDDGKKTKKGQKEVVLSPVEDKEETKEKKTPGSPSKTGPGGSPAKGAKSPEKKKFVAVGGAGTGGKGDKETGPGGSPVKRTKSPDKKGAATGAAAAGVASKGDNDSKKDDKLDTKGKPDTSSKDSAGKKDSKTEKEDKTATTDKKESDQKDLKSGKDDKAGNKGKQVATTIKKDTEKENKAGTKDKTDTKDSKSDASDTESKESAKTQTKSDDKVKASDKSPAKGKGNLKTSNDKTVNSDTGSEKEEKTKSDSDDVDTKGKGKTDAVKDKQSDKGKSGARPTDVVVGGKESESGGKGSKEQSNKSSLQKRQSADSVLDKEDGIRTSTVSLRSDASPTSNETGEASQSKGPKEVKGRQPYRKMGSILGKKKEGGKFVSLEKTETKGNKSVSPEHSKSKKNQRVGFNKSDNEDSGNETDHSHSRLRHKRKKSNFDHIYRSVKSYESIRNNSRTLQQLKRAQIHTGPMHDIVMFSKMMENYRRGVGNDAEEMDVRTYANWDGYLNDQLRFVSHLYNEDSKSPREVQDAAKEQHSILETEANNRKKDTDMRCNQIKEKEEVHRRKNTDMDREIDHLAHRTAEMFDSVRTGASSSLASAKTRNVQLRDDMRKTREEKLRTTEDPHEREFLRRQQLDEDFLDQESEFNTARNDKFKKWHHRKDEEMRRRLLQAYRPYFPNDVFQPRQVCVSGGRVKSAGRLHIDPSPVSSRKFHQSPRPNSHKSGTDSSVSQYRLKEEKPQVQMTPYGLRRVRNQERPTYEDVEDELADAIFFSPSRCTKSADAAANWSRKYDGSIRPRTGLVFVEPRVYDDLMKEEKVAKQKISSEVRGSQSLVNGDVRYGTPYNDGRDSLVS